MQLVREVIHQSQPRNCESSLREMSVGNNLRYPEWISKQIVNIWKSYCLIVYARIPLFGERFSALFQSNETSWKQTINKVDGFSRKTGRETKEKLRN